MRTTWQCQHFKEIDITARYCRVTIEGEIKVYDVNVEGATIRELLAEVHEVCAEKLQEAIQMQYMTINQVKL